MSLPGGCGSGGEAREVSNDDTWKLYKDCYLKRELGVNVY